MTQKNELENFSNLADIWTKLQYRKVQKHMSIAFMRTSRFTKNVVNHDWKEEANKLENLFYSNRAIYYGASKDLPYKTLIILGRMLGEKSIQGEIQQIIDSNIIKFKGSFIKLDDLDKQSKIRKVLRNYQFDQFQSEDIAA